MDAPFVWSLPRASDTVSAVRRQMRRRCGDLPTPLVDDTLLLTSELVTNAIRHGEGDVTVRLWPGPDVVRLEVSDTSSQLPAPRHAGTEAEAGRGLALVDALSSRWGATPRRSPAGKTVWFELDAPRR